MTRETCLLRIAIAHWAEKSTPAAAPTLPLSPPLDVHWNVSANLSEAAIASKILWKDGE